MILVEDIENKGKTFSEFTSNELKLSAEEKRQILANRIGNNRVAVRNNSFYDDSEFDCQRSFLPERRHLLRPIRLIP